MNDKKKSKIKVMAFGTFDLLHPGHLYYLKKAKEKGDELIVLISTDKNAEKIKGRRPINSEKIRLEKIKNISIVDKAILGSPRDMFEKIKKIKPDIIAIGYDQKADWLRKRLKMEEMNIRLIRIGPFETDKYKSKKIAEKIEN